MKKTEMDPREPCSRYRVVAESSDDLDRLEVVALTTSADEAERMYLDEVRAAQRYGRDTGSVRVLAPWEVMS